MGVESLWKLRVLCAADQEFSDVVGIVAPGRRELLGCCRVEVRRVDFGNLCFGRV